MCRKKQSHQEHRFFHPGRVGRYSEYESNRFSKENLVPGKHITTSKRILLPREGQPIYKIRSKLKIRSNLMTERGKLHLRTLLKAEK
jgi:hypothetical protein